MQAIALSPEAAKWGKEALEAFQRETAAEKHLCTAWHASLAAMGAWEAWNHKHKLTKFLAVFFMLWHIDATLSHIAQRETYSKRALRRITGVR